MNEINHKWTEKNSKKTWMLTDKSVYYNLQLPTAIDSDYNT